MSFSWAELRQILSSIAESLADPGPQAVAAATIGFLGALLGVRLAERWQSRRNLRDLRLGAYVRFLGSWTHVVMSKAYGLHGHPLLWSESRLVPRYRKR